MLSELEIIDLISHTELNSVDKNCAIKIACEKGYLELVKILTAVGADLETDYGYPIKIASKNGHLEIIKFIVSNKKSAYMETAIKNAIVNRHYEITQFLLEMCPNDLSYYNDAIIIMAKCGDLEFVKLLESKMPQTIDYNTLLYYGSTKGSLNIVKYALSKGANVNYNDDAAVFFASRYDHLDVVKFLVSKGAKIKPETIMVASAKLHIEVTLYFIEIGMNVKFICEKTSNVIAQALLEKGDFDKAYELVLRFKCLNDDITKRLQKIQNNRNNFVKNILRFLSDTIIIAKK